MWTAGVALISAGGAWGGSIAALRGTKEKVAETAEALKEHTLLDHTMQLETVQRLARIEALLVEIKAQ